MKTFFISCLKATVIDEIKKSIAVHFSELIKGCADYLALAT
jgi:hypothetical protein